MDGFKNRKVGYAFDCAGRTSRNMGKWMTPFDSAHQIGPSTSLQGVLTTGGGFGVVDLKNSEIGAILRYISTTRVAMIELMIPLDSELQIGLFVRWKKVLTIGFGLRFK